MVPADWHDGNWAEYLILEHPWPLALAMMGLAMGTLVVSRRREDRRMRWAGIAMAVCGGALIAAGTMIETPREAMKRKTIEMIDAAMDPMRLDDLMAMMTDEVTVFDRDREAIGATLRAAAERYRITQAHVTQLRADAVDATHGRTYLSLITRVRADLGAGPAQTRWMLHWTHDAAHGWRVERIEWLGLNGQTPDASQLP